MICKNVSSVRNLQNRGAAAFLHDTGGRREPPLNPMNAVVVEAGECRAASAQAEEEEEEGTGPG